MPIHSIQTVLFKRTKTKFSETGILVNNDYVIDGNGRKLKEVWNYIPQAGLYVAGLEIGKIKKKK